MRRVFPYILLSIPLLFLGIYYRTFTTDYAYLDEAHQLWNNGDGSNFLMFLTQGRYLTGRLLDQLFGSIDSISQLKTLRIVSLAGWIITTLSWVLVFRGWIRDLGLNKTVLILSSVFIITSLPVAISIGWASCLEISLASLFGLLSGALLFNRSEPKAGLVDIPGSTMLVSLAFGVCSLLLYQNSFGFFLLPFLFNFFNSDTAALNKRLKIGLIAYLLIYVVYYLVVRYTFNSNHVVGEARTGLTTDVLRKIIFFFSEPVMQAFSINYAYDKSNFLSQAIPLLLILAFVISIFVRFKQTGVPAAIKRLLVVLILLALIYLPSLVVSENFSSYRTLLPLSLAVFVLVVMQLLYFIRSERTQVIAATLISAILIALGYYNFNKTFAEPLADEYRVVSSAILAQYTPATKTIYFVRPSRRIFRDVYGIRSSKDEFGSASTSRDWVPEPLVRQLVMEKTGDRKPASSITILQFADRRTFDSAHITLKPTELLVDANELIRRR